MLFTFRNISPRSILLTDRVFALREVILSCCQSLCSAFRSFTSLWQACLAQESVSPSRNIQCARQIPGHPLLALSQVRRYSTLVRNQEPYHQLKASPLTPPVHRALRRVRGTMETAKGKRGTLRAKKKRTSMLSSAVEGEVNERCGRTVAW